MLGIVLSAFNLRTAVTSLTPLLDMLGDAFGLRDDEQLLVKLSYRFEL